jgi:hypothetical protein
MPLVDCCPGCDAEVLMPNMPPPVVGFEPKRPVDCGCEAAVEAPKLPPNKFDDAGCAVCPNKLGLAAWEAGVCELPNNPHPPPPPPEDCWAPPPKRLDILQARWNVDYGPYSLDQNVAFWM